MYAVDSFSITILVVSAVILAAAMSSRISERIRVPAPALFLIAAAAASDLFPSLGRIPAEVDERIVTVALIFILFDGGMHIGWRRFRSSAGAILWIGLAGTAVTAAAVAVVMHLVFGFDVADRAADRRALSPDRSGRGVLGARPPRDRRPVGNHPRGGVRSERPGRHRADGRDPGRHGQRLGGRRRAASGSSRCRWPSAASSASSADTACCS